MAAAPAGDRFLGGPRAGHAESWCAAISHVEEGSDKNNQASSYLWSNTFADAELCTAGGSFLQGADRCRGSGYRVAPALVLDATILFLQDRLVVLDLVCQQDPACHHRHQRGHAPGGNISGIPKAQALADMRPAIIRGDDRKSTSGR